MRWVLLLVSGCVACGPAVGGGGGGTGGGSGDATGAPGDTGAATSVSTAGGTGGLPGSTDDDDGCESDDPDEDPPKLDIGVYMECDVFAQDCDDGDDGDDGLGESGDDGNGGKCVPWGFGHVRCVPIVAEPLADGEPCEATVDADPCGPLSVCPPGSPEAGGGVCTPLCTGSFAEPVCGDGLVCIIDDEQVSALCQVPCDPFVADACGEYSCQPTSQGFGCIEHGGRDRDQSCYQDDSCGDGLVCPRDDERRCCGEGCCTPLCSPEVPCETGTCSPYSPEVPGAPGVGYCVGA